MKWFIIIILILLLGPLRRPYFSRAAVAIPMTVGAILGIWMGIFVSCRAQVSRPVAIGLSLALAVGMATALGETCKDWFDRNLGKKD